MKGNKRKVIRNSVAICLVGVFGFIFYCLNDGSNLASPPVRNITPSFSKAAGVCHIDTVELASPPSDDYVFDALEATLARYEIELLPQEAAPPAAAPPIISAQPARSEVESPFSAVGGHLTKSSGIYNGPSGKETYYNLPMGQVVANMRAMGYSEEEYPYSVRDDGCKMLGNYIMVAAHLGIRPKGTVLETSLGTAIVCDTGSFANSNQTQIDIAVNW